MTAPAGIQNLAGGQPTTFAVQSAGTAPISGRQNLSWLHRKHPSYARLESRWQQTLDFYYGEVADEAVARKYLVRRFQGEPNNAYDERVRTADFTPHVGTLIDTIAGQLFGVEDRASRIWVSKDGKSALGDPTEKDTIAAQLMMDADGSRGSWQTVWRQFAIDVIVYQKMWVLVDGVPNGSSVVKLIPPTMVPNWTATEVLLKERLATPSRLDDDTELRQTWIKWTLTGWERWTEDSEGNAISTNDRGAYRYQSRAGESTLPIFCVELPMRRYVAWLLAKKAAVLYNQESVRDMSLRIANFTKLNLGVTSDEQYEALQNKLLEGANVLPVVKDAHPHEYISPSSEPTKNATDVLKEKVEQLWVSGFKMFEDAARQATATEINQRVGSGIGAFLQLLKTAVDSAENGAFYLLEQAYRSESRDLWGTASVERSDDFSNTDTSGILDTMRKRYLGEQTPIPVGRSALIQLAKDSARVDGLPVDHDEIEAAVDAQLLGGTINNMEILDVTPALIKARLAMKLVAALGLVDTEEVMEMADGEKQKLFNVMLRQAEELAQIKEETSRRMAELPPFNPAPNADGNAGAA